MIKIVGDYFLHEWYAGMVQWVVSDGKNDLLHTFCVDDVVKFFADRGIKFNPLY